MQPVWTVFIDDALKALRDVIQRRIQVVSAPLMRA